VRPSAIATVFVVLVGSGVGGCRNSAGPTTTLTDVVASASAFGINGAAGTRQSGPPPAAQAGGPPATTVGNDSAFQRGTNAYTVTSSVQFQKVFVSVATGTGGAIVDGFFQIDLSAPATAVDLLVQFGDALPSGAFAVRFQLASPAGVVGAAAAIDTSRVAAPTGAVVLTGQVVQIAPPPDARLGALENDTTGHLFRERTGFVLTSPLDVDFNTPGTFAPPASAPGAIPVGTRADSYYLITDAVGNDPAVFRAYSGTMTFDTDVLGLMGFTSTLASGNLAVGAPGTLYTGLETGVQLEDLSDSATISNNRRTVSFAFGQTTAADNIRIIVASPQTSALMPTRAASLTNVLGLSARAVGR
jgi:hypothetical protein